MLAFQCIMGMRPKPEPTNDHIETKARNNVATK